MVMEYWGAKGGRGAEVERAVALRLSKGQTINDVQVGFSSFSIDNNNIVNISSARCRYVKIIEHSVQAGLLGVCLGERRRLAVEDRSLWNKFADILPDMMEEIQTFLDVEVTGINAATWRVFSSGLKVALLEPVAAERCARTVTRGDTLSVEYSGGSTLQNSS